MTKKILIIDDIRSEIHIGLDDLIRFKDGEKEPVQSVLIARTYYLGLQAIWHLGPWDVLYLDHDLGAPGLITGKEMNGYHVVEELERLAHRGKFQQLPKELICVSANPVGRKKIEAGWKAIQEALPELIAREEREPSGY
jgi:hypothetical protein